MKATLARQEAVALSQEVAAGCWVMFRPLAGGFWAVAARVAVIRRAMAFVVRALWGEAERKRCQAG